MCTPGGVGRAQDLACQCGFRGVVRARRVAYPAAGRVSHGPRKGICAAVPTPFWTNVRKRARASSYAPFLTKGSHDRFHTHTPPPLP